ncbi:MAG: PDZ domain-containing protein [Planctomycetota bacterium]
MIRTGTKIAAVAIALTLASASRALAADGGYLGIYLEDETSASRGAYVEDVAPDSPAEKAGIRRGDLITSWNGDKTTNSHALIDKLTKAGPGDQATIRLSRDEWEKEVKVTLGRREGASHSSEKKPEAPKGETSGERGFLGAYLKANPEGNGAYVDGVVADSPAAKAGLKKGDIVIAADGQSIKEYTVFQDFLKNTKPGQKLALRVTREGWDREVQVTLGRRASDRPAPPVAAKPAEPAEPAKPEHKKPGFLGVALIDGDGKGPLKVDDVMANSPAEKMGIKPGDVIVAIGDKKMTTVKDFEEAMRSRFAGDKVQIRLERDGFARQTEVTLGERTE